MTYSKPTCTASYQAQFNSAQSGLKVQASKAVGNCMKMMMIKKKNPAIRHVTGLPLC